MHRVHLVGCLAFVLGCGSDYNNNVDAPPAIDACTTCGGPPPRVIPGGGIGDGPITDVVNLYVIDDATRMPVGGAMVRIGTVDGTTDATGLFVAHGLSGPQTVVVRAPSYRSETWVGCNGGNVTIDVLAATTPIIPTASLSGTIPGFSAISLPTNHIAAAIVGYSQSDLLDDAANNITTTGQTNICTGSPDPDCAFTVTTRTGKLALLAAIVDVDTKGTATGTDDTFTIIGWATATGLTATSGQTQTGLTLTMVPAADLNTVTADFGSPPSGLTTVAGVVGIELGGDGVLAFPSFVSPASPSTVVPKLSTFLGSTYRLTGIADNGTTPTSATSIVLRRGQTSPSLSAGTWLPAPTGATASRTSASWSSSDGAIGHSVTYTGNGANFLNVTVFDGSSSVTVPDLVALPGSGALTANVSSIAGTIDPMNFSLDNDRAKITAAASQGVAIP
jgi:hypothetical protein